MLVTITTDASFYDSHKAGGYAFWIKSDIATIKVAGAFKGTIETPHDAEFKCIINALHQLKRQNWNITKIFINTDSKSVINAIENKNLKLPEYAKENLKAYKDIIKQFGKLNVSLRYVKAHHHTRTARHWVNQWCDTNAKAAARKKIFGEVQR